MNDLHQGGIVMALMNMTIDFLNKVYEVINPAAYLEKKHKCVTVTDRDDINQVILDFLETI